MNVLLGPLLEKGKLISLRQTSGKWWSCSWGQREPWHRDSRGRGSALAVQGGEPFSPTQGCPGQSPFPSLSLALTTHLGTGVSGLWSNAPQGIFLRLGPWVSMQRRHPWGLLYDFPCTTPQCSLGKEPFVSPNAALKHILCPQDLSAALSGEEWPV